MIAIIYQEDCFYSKMHKPIIKLIYSDDSNNYHIDTDAQYQFISYNQSLTIK